MMARLETYLEHESNAVMIGGSRLVLLAAVASNVDKARWAFGRQSEPGSWSTWLLAGSLEGALAITSYALSEAQKRGQKTLPLWFFTVLFAAMSAVANVAYFLWHVPEGESKVLAYVFGLAAPAIALANGALAGVTTGQKLAQQDKREDRDFQLRVMELEREKAALAVEEARQRKLLANAEARKAKAAAPVSARKNEVSKPSGNGNHKYGSWQEFMADYPNMLEMSGEEIGKLAGVSGRTGRNWKRAAGL